MDDFLVFGESREQLRAIGRQVRDRLEALELDIHPDKYRLGRTRDGVDFVGYTMFAEGRIRLREKSLKNFRRRYRRLLAGVKRGHVKPAAVTASVKSWVAHARHAHSEPLRADLLGRPRWSGTSVGREADQGGGGTEA
jgi:hypothetical protein